MGIGPRDGKCFVETHVENAFIFQPCDGSPVTYFWDNTENHNKTMVKLTNFSPACEMELTIVGPNNNVIYKGGPFGATERIFQAEDVRRIRVTCTGENPDVFCQGFLVIQKTFCICCNDF
ncbi:hypothetical protein [Alkalihalobacterium chitinilyticum]|uniref:DUF3992 domain-containing protein n=1 Tax=Alkalihalobacterium chitinilyticum TaxID=2980103 RepID=A0ABT5VFJ2_9BACI|nr:hypothetical protein [Alkalihalobacterium chitinilyticum]MDE5414235.1 hypothetical protein [Alkalihalobacterium chitinilyticum]